MHATLTEWTSYKSRSMLMTCLVRDPSTSACSAHNQPASSTRLACCSFGLVKYAFPRQILATRRVTSKTVYEVVEVL